MKVKTKRGLVITTVIVAGILVVLGIFTFIAFLVGALGYNANMKYAESVKAVEYEKELPEAKTDAATGYYTFTTDEDFVVLQLTDVHIGAGSFSVSKDSWALKAVTELVTRVKPNLVVVTGDMVYPIIFKSGSINNKKETQLFARLMTSLGVYWTVTLGNHDNETGSTWSREEVGAFYASLGGKCLFTRGGDADGEGNGMVIVKNGAGKITQALITIDSHAYTKNNTALTWEYDNVHENQIEWYRAEIARLTEINGGETPKSLLFLHIPPNEYAFAWEEYRTNGKKDTQNVKYKYGFAGEDGEKVWSPKVDDMLFETVLELGSTQGIFCGHDHLNVWSVEYKGVRLTYGMSIDYLAYAGIAKKIDQRGGTVITVRSDGSFDNAQERLAE